MTLRALPTGSAGDRGSTTTLSRSCCSDLRVAEDDLVVVRPAQSLALRPGGDLVYEFAEAADITIVT